MFFWKTAKETVPERPIRISSVEWRDGQLVNFLFDLFHAKREVS